MQYTSAVIQGAKVNVEIKYLSLPSSLSLSPFFPCSPPLSLSLSCTQVDLIAGPTVIPIIRRQQVILDKSGCAPPTAPPTSPPRSPITTATCSRLEQISRTVNILECSVKDGCAGLTCNDDNHRLDMTLLPCNSPPGLNVKVYNSSNVLIYNANITNDTTFNVDSQVRVRMQVLEVPGGIRVKVRSDWLFHTFWCYSRRCV